MPGYAEAYTPFWLVLMVYQAVISYQKFSVPLLSTCSIIEKKTPTLHLCKTLKTPW